MLINTIGIPVNLLLLYVQYDLMLLDGAVSIFAILFE